MAWQYYGAGNVVDANDIARFYEAAPNNSRVQLSLDLRFSPSAALVNEIKAQMVAAGLAGVQVTTGSPILNLSWIKEGVSSRIAGIQAILIIVGIIMLLVTAIMVIGWRFYVDISQGPGGVVAGPALIIGGLVVLGILAVAYTRRSSTGA